MPYGAASHQSPLPGLSDFGGTALLCPVWWPSHSPTWNDSHLDYRKSLSPVPPFHEPHCKHSDWWLSDQHRKLSWVPLDWWNSLHRPSFPHNLEPANLSHLCHPPASAAGWLYWLFTGNYPPTKGPLHMLFPQLGSLLCLFLDQMPPFHPQSFSVQDGQVGEQRE